MLDAVHYPLRLRKIECRPLPLDPALRSTPVGSVVGVMQHIKIDNSGMMSIDLPQWFNRSKDIYSPSDAKWDDLTTQFRETAARAAIHVMEDTAGRDALLSSAAEMVAHDPKAPSTCGDILLVHMRNVRVLLANNYTKRSEVVIAEDGDRARRENDGDFLSHIMRFHISSKNAPQGDIEDALYRILRKLPAYTSEMFRPIPK